MEGLEDFLFFLFFFGVNTECFYFENEPDVVVVVLVCDFLFCAELLHCSSSICQKFCLTPPPPESSGLLELRQIRCTWQQT